MNACIGCHSCEVACAEQNGLPAGTAWRRVGEIEGGDHPTTRRFHLSMSCNHCLEPACLEGCPTNAYEKLDNGIVAHHADDCIGCQYCTWNCPYSVPAFQPDRRIVTKCDMCLPRLEGGLRPGLRRRLPDPCDHGREGRTSPRGGPTTAAADAPELPSGDLTLSTTRIELPRRRAARDATRPATGTCVPRTRTGRSSGSRSSARSPLGVSATAGSAGERVLAAALAAAGRGRRRSGTSAARSRAWKALRNLRRSWLSREVALLVALRGAGRAPRCWSRRWRPVAAVVGRGRRVRLGPALRRARAPGLGHARSRSCAFFATALALGPPLTGHVGARPRPAVRWPLAATGLPTGPASPGGADQAVAGRGAARAALVRAGDRGPRWLRRRWASASASLGGPPPSCSWLWPSARSSVAGCSSSPSSR